MVIRSIPNRTKSPPSWRRFGKRRIVSRKPTRAEQAVRRKIAEAFRSIRGMHIADVFPPSDRDPSLNHYRPLEPKPRRFAIIPRRGAGKKMWAKRRNAEPRITPRPSKDEAAINAELLQALMSIRGKHIDDVYPPSSADDEVRT